jgi:hypothetical protein
MFGDKPIHKQSSNDAAAWSESAPMPPLSEIMYMPLDIPKLTDFEHNLVMNLWAEYSRPVTRQIPCEDCTPYRQSRADCCMKVYHWEGLSILGDMGMVGEGKKQMFYQPVINARELLHDYFEKVLEFGPFDALAHVWLWQSTQPIVPHREMDDSYPHNEPRILRSLIYDENPRQTFFIYRHPEQGIVPPSMMADEMDPSRRHYIEIPESTSYFSWNNHRCMHGSDHLPGHKKILMAITGRFNPERHRRLMARSWGKYRENIVLSGGLRGSATTVSAPEAEPAEI